MSGQNFLMAPASADERRPYRGLLRGEGERLVFQVENQGCYFWSTPGEGDDPPVFGRHGESDPWEAEAVSLAEHLVLNCIHEAVICHAAAGASSAVLDEARFQAIAARVPALAIGPWRWCETRFHAGAGAFMVASPVGEENGCRYYSVWLGAKCRASLAFLEPLLDETWEYVRI